MSHICCSTSLKSKSLYLNLIILCLSTQIWERSLESGTKPFFDLRGVSLPLPKKNEKINTSI